MCRACWPAGVIHPAKAKARRSVLLGAPRHALDLKAAPLEARHPTGSPMIHVEHLSKHFSDFRRGSVVALEGVSFDVHPGEIFGLLGPNGAGKTTCLRVLSTVLKPTSGVATVAGYDVLTQAAEVRARIGFMSGNTGIYDRMTAWELVEYFARLYGMEEPRLSQRLDEVFSKLQMQEFRDVLGWKMSTGMK